MSLAPGHLSIKGFLCTSYFETAKLSWKFFMRSRKCPARSLIPVRGPNGSKILSPLFPVRHSSKVDALLFLKIVCRACFSNLPVKFPWWLGASWMHLVLSWSSKSSSDDVCLRFLHILKFSYLVYIGTCRLLTFEISFHLLRISISIHLFRLDLAILLHMLHVGSIKSLVKIPHQSRKEFM